MDVATQPDHPTQMNIRIGSALKSAGDAIFARRGMTPSDAVRRLYERVVETGDVPKELQDDVPATASNSSSDPFAACGMAIRMYEEMGFTLLPDDGISYEELLEQVYDEMLAEDDERVRQVMVNG